MRKILLVEDEPLLSETYLTILATQPYVCDLAENGQQALEKCRVTDYDLILLDIMMPVMNGIEFLEHYKNLDTMKEKIIIISNLSSGKEIDKAQELGVQKHIVKSNVSPKQLISTIRYHLDD